jgi:deoxyribonuclease-4
MLHIGYHESSSGGYMAMGKEALSVNADTFAFFTRNPRGGQAKPIDKKDAEDFCNFAKENNFAQLVAHAPYTMNPCSADEGLRLFAKNMLLDDLARMKYTPGNLYNFHPGSHVQQGADVGIELTSKMLAEVITQALQEGILPGTTILVETMAGKGSEIGRTFEEVKAILDRAEELAGIPLGDYLGVCMDSCHIWDGGYDIVNNLDGVITEFDKIVGLNRLKACHLNDSMNPLGAHKDRHAKLGEGHIGFDALVRFVKHDALKNLSFILETPNDHDGYAKEIQMLKDSL